MPEMGFYLRGVCIDVADAVHRISVCRGETVDEDALQKYVNSLGVTGGIVNGGIYEALQRGDFQGLIQRALSEMNPDPLLAAVMRFMLAEDPTAPAAGNPAVPAGGNPAAPAGTTGRDDDGQLDAVRATLRHVTQMLGACPTCCGEEASCPECRGSGKPGSVPSIASAEELRAWIDPALGRVGMHITNQAISDTSPQ